MADAKLTPRRLVDLLHRLDEIEKHGKSIRQHIIEAMAERRRAAFPRRVTRARPPKR